MNKLKIYYRAIALLLGITCLSSCTCTQEKLEQKAIEQDFTELLAVRSRPSNISELKYECRCMDEKIDDINNFTKKMSNSKFGFLYQSLGRQKVATISSYKTSLNCQQLNQ